MLVRFIEVDCRAPLKIGVIPSVMYIRKGFRGCAISSKRMEYPTSFPRGNEIVMKRRTHTVHLIRDTFRYGKAATRHGRVHAVIFFLSGTSQSRRQIVAYAHETSRHEFTREFAIMRNHAPKKEY